MALDGLESLLVDVVEALEEFEVLDELESDEVLDEALVGVVDSFFSFEEPPAREPWSFL
ncbi:MAG: hypothetical protein ACOYNI_06130 [Acidimicrobiia bacterium]